MGVAFLSRDASMMRREAAYKGETGKWKMLVVNVREIRLIGIYVSPSAQAADLEEL